METFVVAKKNSGKYRAGDWVEVRQIPEILETLDSKGCLDGLPFMPEMLEYAGQTFKVYKRADKTCDTISGRNDSRRMYDTVHLEGVRCDGKAHGECDATCLIFWKEIWLKPSGQEKQAEKKVLRSSLEFKRRIMELDFLARKTMIIKGENEKSAERRTMYSCQATELLNASEYLSWKNIGQYFRELTNGNNSPHRYFSIGAMGMINCIMRMFFKRNLWPHLRSKKMIHFNNTPKEALDLKEGDYVRIKPLKDILTTLNKRKKNKGLFFDYEMVHYCGKKARILKRVKKIINDKTGEMINISSDCFILDNVACRGFCSQKRLFCPRSIYSYWREVWLERAED